MKYIITIILFCISNITYAPPLKLKEICNDTIEYNEKYPRPYYSSLKNMLEHNKALHLHDAFIKLIKLESNWDHNSVNHKTKAKGYIQITPRSAKNFKIKKYWLNKKEYQYDLIAIYFGSKYEIRKGRLVLSNNKLNRIKNIYQLYFMIFYPYAYYQRDNNYILGSEINIENANRVRNSNKIFDLNQDSVITKKEVVKYLDLNYLYKKN